jgi:hypothetical protein
LSREKFIKQREILKRPPGEKSPAGKHILERSRPGGTGNISRIWINIPPKAPGNAKKKTENNKFRRKPEYRGWTRD